MHSDVEDIALTLARGALVKELQRIAFEKLTIDDNQTYHLRRRARIITNDLAIDAHQLIKSAMELADVRH